MVNLLQRGASFLATKLQSTAVAGRTVRYRRGSMVSEPINAWVSEQIPQSTEEDPFVTVFTVYDWSFETSDLLLHGKAIQPQKGDRITETLGGEEIEYEVMPGDTNTSGEFRDTSKLITIVHTKRVH